jgi:hypothetical protein
MAIIRKGDAQATRELAKRAIKQQSARSRASKKSLNEAGLVDNYLNERSVMVNPDGTATAKNPRTGRREAFEGPISGSNTMLNKKMVKRNRQTLGSGVIKAGKVVKGSASLLKKPQPKKTTGK